MVGENMAQKFKEKPIFSDAKKRESPFVSDATRVNKNPITFSVPKKSKNEIDIVKIDGEYYKFVPQEASYDILLLLGFLGGAVAGAGIKYEIKKGFLILRAKNLESLKSINTLIKQFNSSFYDYLKNDKNFYNFFKDFLGKDINQEQTLNKLRDVFGLNQKQIDQIKNIMYINYSDKEKMIQQIYNYLFVNEDISNKYNLDRVTKNKEIFISYIKRSFFNRFCEIAKNKLKEEFLKDLKGLYKNFNKENLSDFYNKYSKYFTNDIEKLDLSKNITKEAFNNWVSKIEGKGINIFANFSSLEKLNQFKNDFNINFFYLLKNNFEPEFNKFIKQVASDLNLKDLNSNKFYKFLNKLEKGNKLPLAGAIIGIYFGYLASSFFSSFNYTMHEPKLTSQNANEQVNFRAQSKEQPTIYKEDNSYKVNLNKKNAFSFYLPPGHLPTGLKIENIQFDKQNSPNFASSFGLPEVRFVDGKIFVGILTKNDTFNQIGEYNPSLSGRVTAKIELVKNENNDYIGYIVYINGPDDFKIQLNPSLESNCKNLDKNRVFVPLEKYQSDIIKNSEKNSNPNNQPYFIRWYLQPNENNTTNQTNK
jgi:hypothetical protein